ncbi:MAG: membrane protein insertion efficiency factor YidD [Bacillota bacterium]|jgi:putative membrane protein insertion efficiency factor
MLRIIVLLIKIYQKYISIFLPARCRFYPTCSQYMIDALVKYGFKKGFILGVKRIIKCHPWHPGGYDPA